MKRLICGLTLGLLLCLGGARFVHAQNEAVVVSDPLPFFMNDPPKG